MDEKRGYIVSAEFASLDGNNFISNLQQRLKSFFLRVSTQANLGIIRIIFLKVNHNEPF